MIQRILKWLKGDPRIGKKSQWMWPGWGSCYKCGTTWNVVEGHSTQYSRGSGCFPLCKLCWQESTIEERIPHYEQHVDRVFRNRDDYNGVTKPEMMRDVLAAVREGK